MKFAITIGSYELLDFAELNVLQCRRVFGDDVPILLSDGRSVNSPKMEELAEKHGCYYWGEEVNRQHFRGCMQTTINALVFGKQVGADVTLKINQRLIILGPEIKAILETCFSNSGIMLALPGRPNPASIITSSKFFSKFPNLNDVVGWRVGCLDPDYVKFSYENQVKTRKSNVDTFSEIWQQNIIRDRFAKECAVINALTEHAPGQPYRYLRKVQNSRQDYVDAAVNVCMDNFEFPTGEWRAIKGSNYHPIPTV